MRDIVDKSKTPDMFSEIAGRYDLLNHVLSLNVDRLWRRALIQMSGLEGEGRVLDACTGTADVAIGFARKLVAGSVVGVDRSSQMLTVGRHKVTRNGLDQRVELVESDVLALPFKDAFFDVVTIAFGLRNLPDYQRAVDEMCRVLRPGGRLLVLEFAPPSGILMHGYRAYLQHVLPVIGGVISGSRRAYRYLATSISDFVDGDRVRELMRVSGLDDFRSTKLAGGIAYIYIGSKTAGCKTSA